MSKAEKSGQKADSDANIKYIVKVKTGSVKNASTDSTVSVTMFGNKIKTDKALDCYITFSLEYIKDNKVIEMSRSVPWRNKPIPLITQMLPVAK